MIDKEITFNNDVNLKEKETSNFILEKVVINNVIDLMVSNVFDVMKKYDNENLLNIENQEWFSIVKTKYKINLADLHDVSIASVVKNDVDSFKNVFLEKLREQQNFEKLVEADILITKEMDELKPEDIVTGLLTIKIDSINNELFAGSKIMNVDLLTKKDLKFLNDVIAIKNIIRGDTADFETQIINELKKQTDFYELSQSNTIITKSDGQKLKPNDIANSLLLIKISSNENELFVGEKSLITVELETLTDLGDINPVTVVVNKHDLVNFKKLLIQKIQSQPSFFNVLEENIIITNSNDEPLIPDDIDNGQLAIKLSAVKNNAFFIGETTIFVNIKVLEDFMNL